MLTANRVQKLFDSSYAHPWSLSWDAFILPASGDSVGSQRPRIWTTADSAILEVELPGRFLDEIDVSVERNLLTVTSMPRAGLEGPQGKFRLRERSDGRTTMRFRLPFSVQPEQVNVTYGNGLLRITATRPEEEKPRKVVVTPS